MRMRSLVGAPRGRRLELYPGVKAVQAGGDHRCNCQVWIDVGARQAVFDVLALSVSDHAHRACSVVVSPRDGGRGEHAGYVSLVRVDLGSKEQSQVAKARQLAGQETIEQLLV